MFGDNLLRVLPSRIKSDISYKVWDFKETGIMCGIGGFSCEGAGTLFTIRETMEERHKLPMIVIADFMMIIIMFLMVNFSFYFVSAR
jgi:hypothetical protein